jgi:hypothetical protein
MGRMIMDKKFERYSKAITELGWTTDQDGDVWYTGSNYIPESVLFNLWEASENNFNQGLVILDEMVKEEWGTDYCDGYTMKAKEFLDQYGDKK